MVLLINSFAHFLVDALSVTTLFSDGSVADMTLAVVLYNTLAFGTQCLVGLGADIWKRHALLGALGMGLVVLGYFLPSALTLRVCVAGLGNSLFHVAGGAITLEESGGRAWKLGLFVAPGAFGVTLGTLFPRFGTVLAAMLLLCAGALFLLRGRVSAHTEVAEGIRSGKLPLAVVLLLALAVAVRAVGGSAVSFPWKNGPAMAFLMTVFVFAGKSAGGFVCDRLGAGKTALLSIPLAAVCIAFLSGYMLPSLLGQFLLNLTMPVTLWLMYTAMPDAPGFAFGLAASALWPGTVAGQLFSLTGPALWLCVLLCFAFGLFAILYANKKVEGN